jgi:hypothetical protein
MAAYKNTMIQCFTATKSCVFFSFHRVFTNHKYLIRYINDTYQGGSYYIIVLTRLGRH